VRFGVLMMVKAQNTVFWDVPPYNITEIVWVYVCVCVP